jgi:hypothetical protein
MGANPLDDHSRVTIEARTAQFSPGHAWSQSRQRRGPGPTISHSETRLVRRSKSDTYQWHLSRMTDITEGPRFG